MNLKVQQRLIWVGWGVVALLEGLVLLAKSGFRTPPYVKDNLLGMFPWVVATCVALATVDFIQKRRTIARGIKEAKK